MLSNASGGSFRSQRSPWSRRRWWRQRPPLARPHRRSGSLSCRTARARSARSTTRTSPVSSPRCPSSPARRRRTRTSRVPAGRARSINGHPLKLVGIGCSNDRADTAIKETKRLMEQLKADILIGPLSGDESIAVANYAKQHPTKTFVDGAAGAQDTTLKVRAPNFFRFNGDGASGTPVSATSPTTSSAGRRQRSSRTTTRSHGRPRRASSPSSAPSAAT